MPPKAKAKRASSPGPKAKGAPKAAAKAKDEPAEDPKALIAKEAEEMFDRYEDGGIVKLAGFAECIRNINIKKLFPFGEEPGPVIKEHWKNCGGFSKKEINKDEFRLWWPTFMEVLDAKVAEVAEANQKIEEEKAAKVAAKSARFEGDGLWNIPLEDLKEAMDAAFKKDKTPLILDSPDDGNRAETFFTYSGAYIIECKKMIMAKAKGDSSVEDILKEERDRFFRGKCFKAGQTVVFRLANSAIDIKKVFSNEVFPAMTLLNTPEWKKLLGPDNAVNAKDSPLGLMPEDKDDFLELECMGINEKFRVVAITHFTEEDYAGFLENQFPLELCQPIKVFQK